MPVAVSLPQFAAPFVLDGSGQPIVVEQDSPEEILAAIYNTVVCPQGAKLNDPTFGIPSPLFQGLPLSVTAIQAAIQRIEPRAQITVTERPPAPGPVVTQGPAASELSEFTQLGRVVLEDPTTIQIKTPQADVMIKIQAQPQPATG